MIKHYWLALIPFLIVNLFVAITVFCQPVGASTCIMPTGNDEPYWENTIIVYVNVPLRDFQNLDELKDFLAKDDTNNHVYLKANSNGVVSLNGYCEDLAFQLRDNAEQTG